MKRLRISAISYLNTAPLMWDFEMDPPVRDSRSPIRSLAMRRRSGGRDCRYRELPAAAYASIPGLSILPGVSYCFAPPGSFHSSGK